MPEDEDIKVIAIHDEIGYCSECGQKLHDVKSFLCDKCREELNDIHI